MATDGKDNERHPLEHEWVLWEHAGGAKNPNDWKANMKELCSFSTIEDFWTYFNHVPKPSAVFYDGDSRKKVGPDRKTIEEYSLFKRGIEPEWGDAQNVTGGEWYVRQHLEGSVLDMFWQNLVMGVVGETIEDGVAKNGSNVVNGVRVVDKSRNLPIFRLEIWINSKDAEVKEKVKTKLVQVVTDGVPGSAMVKGPPKFEWKDHAA